MKLPEITININGVEYENTFENDVRIDRTRLEDEFADQATRYAFYAFLAEEAKYIRDRRKAYLDQLYAQLDAEKRTQAAAMQVANPKFKYTEKMCENEVKGDSRYVDAVENYHKASRLAGQLDAATKAISMRRDMLIQMGSNARVGVAPQRVLDTQREHVRTMTQSQQLSEDVVIPQPKPETSTSNRRRRPAKS